MGKEFYNIKLKKIFKQLFGLKSISTPWEKTIGITICTAIPLLIGYFFNEVSLGIVSSLGSYAYTFLANEPYAFRAKKILGAAIAISISVTLGTLLSPYKILIVIGVGLIGFLSIYIFGALKMKGGAIIIIPITFLVGSGMTKDPSLFLKKGFLVLLSGILGLIISMVGYLFDPHRPEIKALKGAFIQLSKFSSIEILEKISLERHKTIEALLNLEETIVIGDIPWEKKRMTNKFKLLNLEANKLYAAINKIKKSEDFKIPKETIDLIFSISNSIETEKRNFINNKSEFKEIYNILEVINNIIDEPLNNISYIDDVNRKSNISILKEEFNKESIVFTNALRYGLVLSLSTLIAFYFGFERDYWIPISCACVMSAPTILATFNKAIQRMVGTIIGFLLLEVILLFKPSVLVMIILSILLTGIKQLAIVRNYTGGAIFITARALLWVEVSSGMNNISHLANVRICNVIIGSLIGLIGTYIIGRKSASSRLPNLVSKVLSSQKSIIDKLKLKENIELKDIEKLKELKDIYFNNFKLTYTTAIGEIHKNEDEISGLWFIFEELENMDYSLSYCLNKKFNLEIHEERIIRLEDRYKKIKIDVNNNKFLNSYS